MSEDSKMRILKLRNSWISVVGFLLFMMGVIYGFFNASSFDDEASKRTLMFIMLLSFYVFVFGLLMMAFFPRSSDKKYFPPYTKLLISGFFIMTLAFPIHIFLPAYESFGGVIKKIGILVIVIGFYCRYREVRK